MYKQILMRLRFALGVITLSSCQPQQMWQEYTKFGKDPAQFDAVVNKVTAIESDALRLDFGRAEHKAPDLHGDRLMDLGIRIWV